MTTTDRLADTLEKPRKVHFWGGQQTITPVFIRAKLGNGKLLLRVTPLSTRPNYYLIRVSSRWRHRMDRDDWHDYLDVIYETIEDQCGRSDVDEAGESYRPDGAWIHNDWPALDLDAGIAWSEEEFPA